MYILQNIVQNLNCIIGAELNICFTMWLLLNITSKYIILVTKFGV